MKLESTKSKHPQLVYEAKLYKILQGAVGACDRRATQGAGLQGCRAGHGRADGGRVAWRSSNTSSNNLRRRGGVDGALPRQQRGSARAAARHQNGRRCPPARPAGFDAVLPLAMAGRQG